MQANNWHIPYNRPQLTGQEEYYVKQLLQYGRQFSGNGPFTKKCQNFFEEKYAFKKCFLTTSCTDALEMIGLLLDLGPKDEFILPSYTFVSTANAFCLRGAKPIFADCLREHPNISAKQVLPLITERTKAIVVVHYAGVAVNMDEMRALADEYNLYLIEDAAQAVHSFWKGMPLGGLGDFGTFSFHETKNIQCGEGGLLIVNNEKMIKKAEIIWEKGTNRSEFLRGGIEKYYWVNLGSSFYPSELIAAFLWAQLEKLEFINSQRLERWNHYYQQLSQLTNESALFQLPTIPEGAQHNGHIFSLLCASEKIRDNLQNFLNTQGIQALQHYYPLHMANYYRKQSWKSTSTSLPNTEMWCRQSLRLPMHNQLTLQEINDISFYIGGIQNSTDRMNHPLEPFL